MTAAVLLAGELLIDFLAAAPEGIGGATRFAAVPGGAPGNAAVAASRAGAQVAIAARVGDDPFGWRLVRTLAELGVATAAVRVDSERATTLAFSAPQAKDPAFTFIRGADAHLSPDDIPPELFVGVGAFGCGGVALSATPARRAIEVALDRATAAGALALFDVNWRPWLWSSPDQARRAFRRILRRIDVVKCNRGELDLLCPGDRPVEERAHSLVRAGRPAAVVVTLGAHGAIWVTASGVARHPGFRVRVRHPVGAGDCFAGNLLAALASRGLPDPVESESLLRWCNAAAALSAASPLVMESMPTREDTFAFLQRAVPRPW